LQEAETLVGEVIQEITFLIQEIHPAALKEKGLAAALREYVFEWSSRTGITANLEITGENRLSLEVEQALYRSMQEALANVARHSGANQVEMALNIQPACVTVSIADNGQGFDLQNMKNGMGLNSIRERVESLSGKFDIDSAPGAGTQLAIHIPVEENL
jgi:signal transduction histidine kinase